MFKDALKELVERTEGGVAGIIMDATGIALESHSVDGGDFDINTIGIEFSVVLGSIKRAAEMLEAGGTTEISIATDKFVTLIRCLGDNYFFALALRPNGNTGRGRYLMRTMAPKIISEL